MATKYRTAQWLANYGHAPQVFFFRNLDSGQVLYSQFPYFSEFQIKKQFQRPNWQNKKPSTRRDIWRVMTVANFNNHEDAVSAYNALVELRHVREVSKKGEANKLRRKSPEGNIWSSANYRPTYTQESVSDLSTVVDELKLGNTKIYWEDLWRKGDDSYWNGELVEHRELGRFSPRVESSVLRRLREQTKEEAKSKAGSQEVQAEESPAV